LYSHSTLINPAYTLTKLGISQHKLVNDSLKILDTLKTEQLHCLSMDIVSPNAISYNFDYIADQATQNQMRLLITHPQTSSKLGPPTTLNLNPLNSSSMYQWPLLQLLKFQSFLLPFTSTHSLLPDLDNSLLSLSWGSQTRMHNEISPASLNGCQKTSSLYLCKQNDILHPQLNATCLGSLSNQDYISDIECCSFNIIPLKELILRVQAYL